MIQRRDIEVWADWEEVGGASQMGTLHAETTRGEEVFSFEYNEPWLRNPQCHVLDPGLGLFTGPQYAGVGGFLGGKGSGCTRQGLHSGSGNSRGRWSFSPGGGKEATKCRTTSRRCLELAKSTPSRT